MKYYLTLHASITISESCTIFCTVILNQLTQTHITKIRLQLIMMAKWFFPRFVLWNT